MTWSVIAKCEAKNNGKWESFERLVAQFDDPYLAQDFIEKCLPAENRKKFYVQPTSLVELNK